MNGKMELTQKLVREIFYYCDGGLYFREDQQHKKAGDRFGVLGDDLYRRGWLRGHPSVYEHRLIYLYHHGEGAELIDHFDRNRENNRIGNLRNTSYSVNSRNSKLDARNTSGHKGVHYESLREKWKAVGVIYGKSKFIGRFDDKEGAIIARKNWEKEVNYND